MFRWCFLQLRSRSQLSAKSTWLWLGVWYKTRPRTYAQTMICDRASPSIQTVTLRSSVHQSVLPHVNLLGQPDPKKTRDCPHRPVMCSSFYLYRPAVTQWPGLVQDGGSSGVCVGRWLPSTIPRPLLRLASRVAFTSRFLSKFRVSAGLWYSAFFVWIRFSLISPSLALTTFSVAAALPSRYLVHQFFVFSLRTARFEKQNINPSFLFMASFG